MKNTYLYSIYASFYSLFKENVKQKAKSLHDNKTLRYEKIHQKYK